MLEKEIREIRERDDLDEIRQQLMDRKNVHSTAIGYKIVDGKKTDEPAVFAYVDEKKRVENLPEQHQIPDSVNGIRTDVHEQSSEKSSDAYSSTRDTSRVRPLVGGVRIERTDGGGTLAICANDGSGNPGVLTAQHVIEDDGGTVVDNMYSPIYDETETDNNNIGTPTLWNADDDWGFVQLDDPSWFTNEVLGFGAVGNVESPRFDSRILVSSSSHGLVGGELWSIDIDGASRIDYEYRLDEDIDSSGASGSLVGWYDVSAGTVKPFGIHVSSNSTNPATKYGTFLQTALDDGGLSLDTTNTYTLDPTSDPAFFEGTVIDVDDVNDEVTCRVLNAGGTETTKTVETRDPGDGSTIDSVSVTLGGFVFQDVVLSTGGLSENLRFYTPDTSWDVDITRYVGEWQLIDQFGDYSVNVAGVDVDDTGSYVAVNPENQYVDVYEYGTWNFLKQLDTGNVDLAANTSRDPSVVFSPDGNWLAAAMSDTANTGNAEVSVFDVSSADPANWVKETSLLTGSDSTYTADFTPDSQFLILSTSYTSNTFRVYETGTWTKVTELAGGGDSGEGIGAGPNGNYVAMGNGSGNLYVYNVGNVDGTGWTEVTSFSDSTSNLSSVIWSNSGDWLVSGGWDDTTYIYSAGQSDGTGWTLEQTLQADGSIYSQQVTPDDQFLLVPEGSGPVQKVISIYTVGDWVSVEKLGGFGDSVQSVDASSNNVISAVSDDVLRVHSGPYHIEPPIAPSDLTATLR